MNRLHVSRMCDRAGAVIDQDGRVVVECCYIAHGPRQRLIGLLRTSALDHGTGLWLEPCGSVHTVGMSFAIDAAFLASNGRVLCVERDIPSRRLRRARGAQSVVETRAFGLSAVRPGDVLHLKLIAAQSG